MENCLIFHGSLCNFQEDLGKNTHSRNTLLIEHAHNGKNKDGWRTILKKIKKVVLK